MIVTERPHELSAYLEKARHEGKRTGLHPTMGALHGGHRANIRQMATECDVAAVTIFVNPLQFGPGEDFAAYPRDLEQDLAQAEEAGADIVLAPGSEFAGEPLTSVHVARLTEVLEGARRPGHFDGVATIVTKILAVAGPCYAYFGEKDYQQLVVVRRLVSDLSLPVVVVACPTVREPDGLALSSRNAYLSGPERAAAPSLYWSLLAGKRAIDERGERDAGRARAEMLAAAGRQPLVRLDYVEVVDPETLGAVSEVEAEVRLVIAGQVGPARLIDNIAANVQEG
ncbi:MAG TPA: pantoate--beta-alanine ligase [Acidimicrobiales bacterium]|nr:pantoate--beta-alanine ligase [Acidimicrobiales bacterium]